MTLLSVLAETEAGHVELPIPAFFFGLIAFVVFVALAIVTWSYRDVAHRHRNKWSSAPDHHGADHHGAASSGGH